MSPDRFPGRDLRLEKLSDRDGMRPAPLGEIGHVASPFAPVVSFRELQAAYETLIDVVFTAPGAAEWLSGMKLAMAALFAAKDKARQAMREAIKPADAGPGRV
jgi:hypothetical protein